MEVNYLKEPIRKILAILLVLVLVVGTGFYSYGNEEPEEPGQPEDPEEPEEPEDPEEPEEPEEPEDPEDPEEPEEPEDPEDPEDPEEPEEPEIIEEAPVIEVAVIPNKNSYTVGETIYYSIIISNTGNVDLEDVDYADQLTGGENIGELLVEQEVEIEKEYKIPLDYEKEVITDIVYVTGQFGEVMVEGEDGFEVTVGGMYRVASQGGLEYKADSAVFELYMKSQNDHTKAIFAWIYQGELYLAIGSMEGKEILTLKYQENVFKKNPDLDKGEIQLIVESANNKNELLRINDKDYNVSAYIDKQKPRWNVVKLGKQILASPFTLMADLGGGGTGGHDIEGEIDNIEITKSFLVYHQYGDEDPVLDQIQSGSLDEHFGYSAKPEYKDGYNLVRAKIIHNGEPQDDKFPGDLDENGRLNGEVQPEYRKEEIRASAVITFIYEKTNDGQIEIKKVLEDSDDKYSNKEFHIFIHGPNDKTYVVSLKPGEFQTISGLEYGTYIIEEVVPMNFKLVGMTGDIENNKVTVDSNKLKSVTINNKHTNNGWFWDDDEEVNTFPIIIISEGTTSNKGIDLQTKDFALNIDINPFKYIALQDMEYLKKLPVFN